MATIISGEEFGGLFQSFRQSAFRLETLDSYAVPEEADEYRRFLAGEELPNTAGSDWLQFVKTTRGQGKIIQRVHAISLPLPPYLKYEIHWGYLYTSSAGEEIRLVDRNKLPRHLASLTDFWLFDRQTLVMVRYDSAGRFLRGEREDFPEIIEDHIRSSAVLFDQAVPLRTFLAQERNG